MADMSDSPLDDLPRGGYPPGFVPHLAVPFRLARGGRVAVVDQGTDEEIVQCVRVILSTTTGSRGYAPSFGIRDRTFRSANDAMRGLTESVMDQEPRATVDLLETIIMDDALEGRIGVTEAER